ncbi:hypothetical protein [Paenibacillus senegalensis]|uniref:hypothetical protein n=1 Tax=Paenibacillus senegalensis TaxID=1465766 RepID=UPI000287C91A|nr:hypothetical protein [Paenibacillus senegalensis]
MYVCVVGNNDPNRSTSPNHEGSADWNAAFIIWDDETYVINRSDTEVEYVDEIEGQIGAVETYSDEEGAVPYPYPNKHSNYLEEGNKLYKIRNIEITEAIAAEYGDQYIKAKRQEL